MAVRVFLEQEEQHLVAVHGECEFFAVVAEPTYIRASVALFGNICEFRFIGFGDFEECNAIPRRYSKRVAVR